MKNKTARLSAVVCALVLAATASRAQQDPTYKELPNFHRVSAQLYRGAQPLGGGMKTLSELGVKTVVNLRGEGDGAKSEQTEAEAAGLRYFNMPMPGLSAPSDKEVARVIDIINNPDNQPVFIHCKRGSDRTGTIAAVYRIARDGWTADRAIAEARRYGMSWAEFGMRSYISNFYKQQLRSKNQPAAATSH